MSAASTQRLVASPCNHSQTIHTPIQYPAKFSTTSNMIKYHSVMTSPPPHTRHGASSMQSNGRRGAQDAGDFALDIGEGALCYRSLALCGARGKCRDVGSENV